MNIGLSFMRWDGVGSPTWIGAQNYTRLFHDSNPWASFSHSGAIIVAMPIVATITGVVIAAALFDHVGASPARSFGPS